jgi:hypothetical protein
LRVTLLSAIERHRILNLQKNLFSAAQVMQRCWPPVSRHIRLRNGLTVHSAKIRISALHFIHDIDNHYQNISYCCYLFLLRNDPQKDGE